MIKKIIIGIVVFAVVWWFVGPLLGKFFTLVLAFGALFLIFGLFRGKKKTGG